jgi:hypothetical protein
MKASVVMENLYELIALHGDAEVFIQAEKSEPGGVLGFRMKNMDIRKPIRFEISTDAQATSAPMCDDCPYK